MQKREQIYSLSLRNLPERFFCRQFSFFSAFQMLTPSQTLNLVPFVHQFCWIFPEKKTLKATHLFLFALFEQPLYSEAAFADQHTLLSQIFFAILCCEILGLSAETEELTGDAKTVHNHPHVFDISFCWNPAKTFSASTMRKTLYLPPPHASKETPTDLGLKLRAHCFCAELIRSCVFRMVPNTELPALRVELPQRLVRCQLHRREVHRRYVGFSLIHSLPTRGRMCAVAPVWRLGNTKAPVSGELFVEKLFDETFIFQRFGLSDAHVTDGWQQLGKWKAKSRVFFQFVLDNMWQEKLNVNRGFLFWSISRLEESWKKERNMRAILSCACKEYLLSFTTKQKGNFLFSHSGPKLTLHRPDSSVIFTWLEIHSCKHWSALNSFFTLAFHLKLRPTKR